ncbi:MAG: AMP-binding protein [Methanosarcinaceae archaeon]|nr:AMP-binding protein [Methanosarcinaceae archaeon]
MNSYKKYIPEEVVNLPLMLKNSAKLFPSRPSLTSVDGTEYSYEELDRATQHVAVMLKSAGVGRGNNVAILADNSPHWGISYFGTLICGATTVPILPDFRAMEVRSILEHAAREAGLSPACGTYMGVNGPTYETPAEIDAFERLGADAIGMSTVPESILANAAGIKVGGLSCIANQTRGRTDKAVSHSEVLCTVEESARNISKMLVAAWRALSEDHSGLLA